MGAEIYTIPLGFTNSYVIRDEGAVMIDAGDPKKGSKFLKSLESTPVKPEDIQLIVFTHGHWDHIGSAAEIKKLTGAKVALHQNEKQWLEESMKPIPPPITTWGRVSIMLFSWVMFLVHIEPTQVDIVLTGDPFPLSDYGIAGKVLSTPGHSSGSVSILLDSGEAFVGDLAMNKFPLRLSPGMPIYGDDTQALAASWRRLMDEGAKTVYPAHGAPFSVDIIKKALEKW